MGIEQECFVHPERISSQLICPICTNVLENPVQTPLEHLFCEDELLEWMTRSTVCPVTKTELDPVSIRPAQRIIHNMLAELERYCPNKSEGCKWTGPSGTVSSHLKTCKFLPREDLVKKIEDLTSHNTDLEKLSDKQKKVISELKHDNERLNEKIVSLERRLRVYEAFNAESKIDVIPNDLVETSLQKIARLRKLESFSRDDKE